MTASLALQYAIIAVAVLVSAWVVFRKQAPAAADGPAPAPVPQP